MYSDDSFAKENKNEYLSNLRVSHERFSFTPVLR